MVKQTKKEHLTKGDIAFLLQGVLYDVSDLVNGKCEDPEKTGEDITYVLNVISEQLREYYFTREELREIDKENEQRRDFMKINF
jgi:hypothetical protein